MDIQENKNLSQLTTFGVGGLARFFVEVSSTPQAHEALNWAKEKGLRVFILGNGSNIVISDDGLDGLVVLNRINGLQITDHGLLSIGAGENWDDVVKLAVENALAGIECLSGVPGSAGGAVVQNIGAYGQTLGDRVIEVIGLRIKDGRKVVFKRDECEFEYRNSLFKKNLGEYLITSLTLRLEENGNPTTSYPHVQKHFAKRPNPTLDEVRKFIIQLRASKGYLIMPGHESYKTAGSFFKNPVISREQFEPFKEMFGDISFNRFWETPNGIKLAAAFLMQEAGFGKGYREGNVGISPKHSLSLVNFNNAKAVEIKALADKIKAKVLDKYNVKLDEEVLYVGNFIV